MGVNKTNNRAKYRKLDLETRDIVLARDRYSCVVCGIPSREVHEIVPRSRFGSRRMHECFKVGNRITLCRSHHEEAHTQTKRKQMLEMLMELYGYTYTRDDPQFMYLLETS